MGRLKLFEKSCMNAADTAQERLLSLLKDNEDTEYGEKYHFSQICSISDYKKQVPFSVFDDYRESVDKMMCGKKNVLTAYPISFYAHTSGTLGAAKNIPFTEKAADIVRSYASISSEAYAELLSGKSPRMPSAPKILYLATAREDHAPDGSQITNFSGKFILEQKKNLQKTGVKPELIFSDEQTDLSYLFAFYALREKDLVCIRAPFMAAVSDFFCYIEKHWKALCRDIEEGVLRPEGMLRSKGVLRPEGMPQSKGVPQPEGMPRPEGVLQPEGMPLPEGVLQPEGKLQPGDAGTSALLERLSADLQPDPERAGELREIFHRGFDHPIAAEVWPSLCYVQAIGAAGFSSYTMKVKRFIGEIPIFMSVYAASEGLFAISVQMNSPEYVIVPEAGYFEFIPEEDADLPEEILREHTLEMNQLQPGKKYEMVVTNLSGFYRYRIGDVVVNGYHGQSPVICFSYRRHQILNITGEKTHEDMIRYAMNSLRKYAGINIVEWSACADYSTSPARYLFFLETDPELRPEKKREIRNLLDQKLAEASEYYAHYRQEKKLGPLELILLQPQTFALYRDIQVWNGASPNQLKPIHVIKDPKTEAFFRGLKTPGQA